MVGNGRRGGRQPDAAARPFLQAHRLSAPKPTRRRRSSAAATAGVPLRRRCKPERVRPRGDRLRRADLRGRRDGRLPGAGRGRGVVRRDLRPDRQHARARAPASRSRSDRARTTRRGRQDDAGLGKADKSGRAKLKSAKTPTGAGGGGARAGAKPSAQRRQVAGGARRLTRPTAAVNTLLVKAPAPDGRRAYGKAAAAAVEERARAPTARPAAMCSDGPQGRRGRARRPQGRRLRRGELSHGHENERAHGTCSHVRSASARSRGGRSAFAVAFGIGKATGGGETARREGERGRRHEAARARDGPRRLRARAGRAGAAGAEGPAEEEEEDTKTDLRRPRRRAPARAQRPRRRRSTRGAARRRPAPPPTHDRDAPRPGDGGPDCPRPATAAAASSTVAARRRGGGVGERFSAAACAPRRGGAGSARGTAPRVARRRRSSRPTSRRPCRSRCCPRRSRCCLTASACVDEPLGLQAGVLAVALVAGLGRVPDPDAHLEEAGGVGVAALEVLDVGLHERRP